MPYYIKNRLIILGDSQQVKTIVERYTTHHPAKAYIAYNGSIACRNKKGLCGLLNPTNGEFTTNDGSKVIGIPEDYEIDIKPAYDHFPDFEQIIPQPENFYKEGFTTAKQKELAAQGIPDWFTWNITNWGACRNSLDCKRGEKENEFVFETVWSGVPKLMSELSAQNKGIEFAYEFADEDPGFHCAAYKFLDGEITYIDEPEYGSKEAHEIAFRLRPEYKNDYRLIDNNYVYIAE